MCDNGEAFNAIPSFRKAIPMKKQDMQSLIDAIVSATIAEVNKQKAVIRYNGYKETNQDYLPDGEDELYHRHVEKHIMTKQEIAIMMKRLRYSAMQVGNEANAECMCCGIRFKLSYLRYGRIGNFGDRGYVCGDCRYGLKSKFQKL